MTIHDILNSEFLLATSIEILSDNDTTLTVGDDFENYRKIVAEHRLDEPLGRPFDL